MSLANIQGKLSRKEMKSIMAGSGSCNERDCGSCPTLSPGFGCTSTWGTPWGNNYYCGPYYSHGGQFGGYYCSKAQA